MNILVTGGLGHIGSRLINSIEADKIIVVDNFMTQRYSSLFSFSLGRDIHFYEKGVQEISFEWLESIGPIDLIIHLAAMTDAAGNANNRDALFDNNFEGTKHLANLALRLGIKFIFPSSTSVYGSQSDLVDESCVELLPQSPYAESKLAEEKLLLQLSEEGLPLTILRFGTIHGVSGGMRFHTAVNRFIFQVKLDIPLTVWRTALDQKRPYLSLDDCSSAVQHVINESLFSGEIYNIVTNNWTVNEIIQGIEKISGRSTRINYVDVAIMNQLSYEVSSLKFQETGFSFCGDLLKDIRDTLNLLEGIKNV
jgi:nucleoside-diphosphate-sugar epimerase